MKIPRKYKKYLPGSKEFPGFPTDPQTNYWPYPRALNGWWHEMTGSEQKVLDYILRHIWGYNKNCDSISVRQFKNGIYSQREHKWFDRGTGLATQAIVKAIRGLEDKKFIVAEKKRGKTTRYYLNKITKEL